MPFKLVADFFGFQFDQGVAGLHAISFALQPSHHNRFGAGDAAGFRYDYDCQGCVLCCVGPEIISGLLHCVGSSLGTILLHST